jgi:hypothetical protein
MNKWSGLIACGVITMLAVAGCGSSGSSASTSSVTPAASTGTSTSATASASGSAATGGGALPSWAAGLGTGVTMENPTNKPAAGTPQATVNSFMYALISGENFSDGVCTYLIPSSQAACESTGDQAAQQGDDIVYSDNSFDLGYTAIDGTQALVGATYTQFCVQVEAQTCMPDVTDPKAAFDSGKSFADLWTQTLHTMNSQNASTAFSPVPCVEINGKWYIDATFGSS